MTPADLASARWFRAKHRRIEAVREVDRAAIGPGELVVLDVTYADGGESDRYLVPRVGGQEPADGEGLWAGLVGAMARHDQFGGFVATGRPDAAAGPMGERRLGVEQSNTSVVIGERLILKLYRLLEGGENPDLEIGAFLTDVGFPDTPAVAGSITYARPGTEASAAVMLAELVPARGDGWAAMLEVLATDPGRGIELAARVGELTARLHAALASRPDEPAFPARAATVAEAAAWRASSERQLAQAVAAVSAESHERLVALAPAVTARFADTYGSATGAARVSRIHGDYHLGQLLARLDGSLAIIDFEGEPARPLAERRLPASPLRDVAGMLRSLDYAARTGQRAGTFDAAGWLERARDAFLAAYGGIGPAEEPLLAAFELEKACYEVRYEAGNRPDWVWLPLAAVEHIVGANG